MVMTADAGVGKTTVSRKLVHHLSQIARSKNTIPIYVEAEHWKNHVRSGASLFDVIRNSTDVLDAAHIPEEVLVHALRQGYLCFIFDGFDELCNHHNTTLNPADVFDELYSLSRESARILITMRTSFWEARVRSKVPSSSEVPVIALEPFNNQQARGYFRRVFGQGPQYKVAEALHKKVAKGTIPHDHTGSIRDEVFNLPFCVCVLADYVKSGGDDLSDATLYGLLIAICTREKVRQSLTTSAEEQIKSFVDVSLAYNDEQPRFQLDDLLSLPGGGFQEPDRDAIKEHALMQRGGRGGYYSLRYEFLAPYLRALGVRRRIMEDADKELRGGVADILESECNGEGRISSNLDQLFQPHDIGRLVDHCHRAVRGGRPALASFFFHVALKLSRRDERIKSDRERTNALIGDRHDGTLVNWSFWGTLEGLDLRDLTLRRCSFSDVRFHDCEVNGQTVFDDCTFDGDLTLGGNWGAVDLRPNCTTVLPNDAVWERALGREVGNREARAEELLHIALSKFWVSGTLRGSIAKSNWPRGWGGERREADRVLRSMLRAGLVSKIHISGVSDGGYAFDRNSLAALKSFMDSRQTSGKIRTVFDDLVSHYVDGNR